MVQWVEQHDRRQGLFLGEHCNSGRQERISGVIDYTLEDLDGLSGTMTSTVAGTEESLTSVDAFDLAGSANGTVTPVPAGKVLAGDYTGLVVITLTPGA